LLIKPAPTGKSGLLSFDNLLLLSGFLSALGGCYNNVIPNTVRVIPNTARVIPNLIGNPEIGHADTSCLPAPACLRTRGTVFLLSTIGLTYSFLDSPAAAGE